MLDIVPRNRRHLDVSALLRVVHGAHVERQAGAVTVDFYESSYYECATGRLQYDGHISFGEVGAELSEV